ncbi:MAG: CGLD27 family protein [Cyanobacteria bacterium SID2]|nr:CGLD27 family protein [Cyanobacteria bacterium SID2]MBP0006801.1 CGLD27 family protein [Cyanobacteria bacterium SBC]
MNDLDFSACPVPEEQQPINEYQALKESCLFRSSQGTLSEYIQALAWIWIPSWVVVAPVAAASFPPAKLPVQFFLSAFTGVSFVLSLGVLRLYLGWKYVRDRLDRPVVEYEESGWYDGQTWTKPPDILTRDRLVASFGIDPVLKRLSRTFSVLGLSIVAGVVGWLIA